MFLNINDMFFAMFAAQVFSEQSQMRIEFVQAAVRFQTRIVFSHINTANQLGLSLIAFSGIDFHSFRKIFRENNQEFSF
jgi:hypothetical protein